MKVARRARRTGVVAVFTLAALVGVGPQVRAQRAFPYRLGPLREGVLLAGGAAALALSVDLNARMDPLTAAEIAGLDPEAVNGFDRPATRRWSTKASHFSDAGLVATVGVALSTVALARAENGPVTVGVMLGETLFLGNGISQLIKTGVRRTRPYVYNSDPAIPADKRTSKSARQSFPSGHAMNAFASAVFLSTVYGHLRPTSPARIWVWAGSLTAAGTVSYLRYSAGKHFPTDLFAGAVLGGAVGWLVPRIHEGDRVRIAAGPGIEGTVVGVSVGF